MRSNRIERSAPTGRGRPAESGGRSTAGTAVPGKRMRGRDGRDLLSEARSYGREKGVSVMRFPMLSRRCWSLGVLIVVGLTLTGLHPAAKASQDATAVASPVTSALQWAPCDDVADAECAWLEVPIDPAQPDGPQLSLRLGRLPALDPSRSQGSLLIIPGGPGVGITAAGGHFGDTAPPSSISMSCGKPTTWSPTTRAASGKAAPSAARRRRRPMSARPPWTA